MPMDGSMNAEAPSVVAEHLSREYGVTVALQDLSFAVHPGEILGLLGPNGAGKSTTVKILTGMIKPTGGRARVAGFDVVTQPLEVKRRIGYVPETGALFETLTASEYIDFVAALHHLDPSSAADRGRELLDVFGLREWADRRLAEYSKGMKQKVAIVAALLHNPEVIFLDEPLDGLDANAALLVKQLLRQLAAQRRTIVFCSHILDVVERICSRLVIIDRGRRIADGTPAEIARATSAATLEEAFSRLTGVHDVTRLTADFLSALERG
jgi:ABC-2 type transport system ATP-binding protein